MGRRLIFCQGLFEDGEALGFCQSLFQENDVMEEWT
jgi:hypothetical protein